MNIKGLSNRRLNIALLIMLVLLGPVVAIATYSFTAAGERNRLSAQFEKDVGESIFVLEAEIKANIKALFALQALYHASDRVTAEEFSEFSSSMRQRNPAIHTLEWIPRVSAGERLGHEARGRRRSDLETYEITERNEDGELVRAKERKTYFPVYLIEPSVGNESAIGFDLASNPNRRTALIEAMASDKLTVTDPITVDPKEPSKAFLAFVPVYTQEAKTFPERWNNLEGFVLGIFRINELLQESLLADRRYSETMAYRLVDPEAASEPLELYRSQPKISPLRKPELSRRAVISLGPQKWELYIHATPAYLSTYGRRQPLILSISIFLIWELLVGAIAILLKRSIDLEKLARLDSLTGLSNRRYFTETIRKEWERAKRQEHPISVIMVDVDYFKHYNDSYGHRAGDECLQRIAAALKTAASRATDMTCRYGGEEFVILLPNIGVQGTQTVAHKLQNQIKALAIPHKTSNVSKRVTVSIGCATQTNVKTSSWEYLVARADAAMYQAKQKGRNQIAQGKIETSSSAESQR
ncbi:MAG: diguanylate cyclase [Cyanobacteria bacterium P01_A01_bin.17]